MAAETTTQATYEGGSDVVSREYFNAAGQRVDRPVNGINIVRQTMKDGSVKVIYPAVEGDDTIWGEEGLWDLNRSLEVLDMSDFWEAFGADGEAVRYP